MSGNHNFGFPPDAREIAARPMLWKSISRAEALARFRRVPVAVVQTGSTGAQARWFDESNPFFPGNGPYALESVRYYELQGAFQAKKPPPRTSTSQKPEEEWEPMFPEKEKEPDTEQFWVELNVKDEEGIAAGGVTYAVELPDGSLRRGRLDSQGKAKVHSPIQGEFKISFPEMDASAWEPA